MTPRVATVYLPLADPSSSPTWACGELVGSCQQVSRYAIVWRAAQPHPGTPEHIVPAEAPVHQRPRCTDLQAVHLAAPRHRALGRTEVDPDRPAPGHHDPLLRLSTP